ncbi:Methyltransferase domain-containing protein [Alkalicoccus daliensis]|uniref:Methyltransferase domain-containing protein n=2 Tax=Alkalicoccus daliensis TaxID=745820 RepID=A0A1H0D765_9BACI|nr:Methyltransferase domain-containing protein [Alkalicoccus daliensis]
MIGVDIHAGMLAEAKNKASHLQQEIAWIQDDCTELALDIESELIYSAGNSFQHFITNESQDLFLSSVFNHLKPEGIFIFDTRSPHKEELQTTGMKEFWKSYIDAETSNKVDVFTFSNYNSLTQVQNNITIRRHMSPGNEILKEIKTQINLRYSFPKEMERMLHENGFEIVNVYQDWEESPLTGESKQMIYICKKQQSGKKRK